jgi:hypothetical protein
MANEGVRSAHFVQFDTDDNNEVLGIPKTSASAPKTGQDLLKPVENIEILSVLDCLLCQNALAPVEPCGSFVL